MFQALEQLILQFVALGHGDVEEAKRWHQSFGGLTSFLCYGPLIFPALNYMLSYFPLRTNNILCPPRRYFKTRAPSPGKIILLLAKTGVSGIGGPEKWQEWYKEYRDLQETCSYLSGLLASHL